MDSLNALAVWVFVGLCVLLGLILLATSCQTQPVP